MVGLTVLSNVLLLSKDAHDDQTVKQDYTSNCDWREHGPGGAVAVLRRLCWELRNTQLVAWSPSGEHLHREVVRGHGTVLPVWEVAFKGRSSSNQNECTDKKEMNDFLSAAKATPREPTAHQSAAWNWAWDQFTKEQRKEFNEIFNSGPEHKERYAFHKAIDLIKEWEGFSPTAYGDPITKAEPYTIGYGSTYWDDDTRVRPNDSITKEQAETLLVNTVEAQVVKTLSAKIPHWRSLTANQRSALVSFAYNVGWHFYGRDGFETISHALREKDYAAVPRIFSLYVNPGSAAEAGLRNRRRAEGKLWGYPTGSVLLKVAYETQHDNGPESYRECLSSCCGMLARYHHKVNSDDDYNFVRQQFGDTVQVQSHIDALRHIGLTPRFDSAAGQDKLEAELRGGHPLALGWLHKGHVGAPMGFGHWCVCIGIDEEKDCYVMHDPYGEADMVNGNYLNHDGGCAVKYSKKNFLSRWMPDGPNTGWLISVRR